MTTPTLERELREWSESVTASMRALVPQAHGAEAQLYQAMDYVLTANGKGLRPFLVLATSDLFDGARVSALRVSVAVELVHSYSLVHDDLPAMDDDDMRRGRQTCHKRYDEATAILVGDALLTLAFAVLAEPQTHADADVRCQLIRLLAEKGGACGMVGGQMADLVAQKRAFSYDDIASMQKMKTGALLSFACLSGGILAQADQKALQALEAYAVAIGLAFQIVDDILDAVGDERRLGKRAGKDDQAQKATFVSLLGIDAARKKSVSLIDEALAHMAYFGKKGQRLCDIARFIIERQH